MSVDKNALWVFGEIFMRTARDLSISQEFSILDGTAKAPLSKSLRERIGHLNEEQIESIKDLVIDAIDHALNNFLWIIEQSDEFDLIVRENDKIISLKEISDGLCGDYTLFIDRFSQYKALE